MDLYRQVGDGQARPERLTNLPPGRNISWLTAGSGEVMVAEARDGSDKISRVVGGRLERFIDDRVFAPALSEDGKLAYSLLRYEPDGAGSDTERWSIHVRDLNTGSDLTVHESPKPLGGPRWMPDGSLAALETQVPDYNDNRVLVIAPDGQIRDPGVPRTAKFLLLISSNGRIAIGESPAIAILDLSNPVTAPLRRGWLPLAWSPDGNSLLMSRGRQLGLVTPPELSTVRPIGAFPVPVWTASWLAPGADAVARPRAAKAAVRSMIPTKEKR